MLNSRFETQPIGELLPQPTAAHSALLAAQKPFYEVGGMGADIVPGLSSEEGRKRIADKLDVINNTLHDSRQGWTQKGLNGVSEIASSIAATVPLAYLGAEVAGGAAAIAGFGGEIALPETALNFMRTPINKMVGTTMGDYLPKLTSAELAKGVTKGYGAYKGMVLPEHIVENYHKENDTLDMRGAIKDWSADNYGFLLPAVPLTAGYLLYKMASVRFGANEAKSYAKQLVSEHEAITKSRQSDLQFAMGRAQTIAAEEANKVRRATQLEKDFTEAKDKGHVSQHEHDWYMEYLKNPDAHEQLKDRAITILRDAQIPFDRVTGRVWFPLFESNDIKNLKQTIGDQVASNFSKEEQSAMSDFVVHNRMDSMRSMLAENPGMVNALRGYTDFIDKKLVSKDKSLGALDEILNKHLPKGLKKNEAFSQKRIYKHLKKMGIRDLQNVPYTVPDNVLHKLKLAGQLEGILRQKSPRYRQWFQEGMHEKIKADMKAINILNPNEEIEHLKSKLLTPKGLIKNFERNRAYHRLRELADVWSNAKHLLDRIQLEHEYGKQAAFNNVLKSFVDMVDSNASRLANPERVTQYMKRRIETQVPFARELVSTPSDLGKQAERGSKREGETEVKETPKENAAMKANREIVDKSKSKQTAAEFKVEENRFNQFSQNESTLKKLIECALGGLSG